MTPDVEDRIIRILEGLERYRETSFNPKKRGMSHAA